MADESSIDHSNSADANPTCHSPEASGNRKKRTGCWKRIRSSVVAFCDRSQASASINQSESIKSVKSFHHNQTFINGPGTVIESGEQRQRDEMTGHTTTAIIHRQEDPNQESATLVEGDFRDMYFTGSSVTVGGDSYKLNVYGDVHSPDQGGEDFVKLIKVVNDNTKQKTNDCILEDFKNEGLHEPSFQVFPLMRSFEPMDYYKGRYKQLVSEFGFQHQESNDDNFVTFANLMTSILEGEQQESQAKVVTAVVASAGSGKTILMRRIARKALDIQSDQEQSTPLHYKMVHYIEIKNIENEDSVKPSRLLFRGLYASESGKEQIYNWLVENQNEAVLIFDGLDQARWNFDEIKDVKINHYDAGSTSTIMYNILSRNILPRVKILISSREFKVSELPARARPTNMITLAGLTEQDAEKLFVHLIGAHGQELWNRISNISPRLLHLISIPVFLILTAVVTGRDPNKPPPFTVTELYNRIISNLQSVENIRQYNQIVTIINKLKLMAFQGMTEGRVIFYETDLKKFNLTANEVQDLMMKVPDNNLLSRRLMEGDFTFCFCHQSIQEFLAASCVAELSVEEFTRFDNHHLHDQRWSVVRQFAAGVVFSESSYEIHRVSNQSTKQQVLTRSILSQLDKKTKYGDNYLRMELYTAIYESNAQDLMKNLTVINVSRIPLSRDQAHIIGSLAADNESLHSLKLCDCNIDNDIFRIIKKCLKHRIHVGEVDLRYNKFSTTELTSLLGHCRIESLNGNLDWKVVLVTTTEDGLGVELTNKASVIKIRGAGITGRFDIEESTLKFDEASEHSRVIYCCALFGAKHLEVPDEQLNVKYADFRTISKTKLKKISKIVLDCTEEENVDWRFIEECIRDFQVEVLDIAVHGHTCNYDEILKHGNEISNFGVIVKIHSMFFCRNAAEFKNIVTACQDEKIEYNRCIIWFPASLDDIASLVNSNSKKVTLIYRWKEDMLSEEKLKEVQRISSGHYLLEILFTYRFVKDAWQELDKGFQDRELRRKEQDDHDS